MTRLSQRHRRIWLLLGWGMVAAVVVLSLIPLDVDFVENEDKLAHFVAYGGLAFWFGMLIEGRGRELGLRWDSPRWAWCWSSSRD